MTDRARAVYALVRTLFAWTPPPATSRTGSVLASQQRGFVSKSRFLTCPDCLANGRPEGMHGCETCGGRGEVPDDGEDPYDKGVSRGIVHGRIALSYRAADENDFLRATKEREAELRRLEFQLFRPKERKHEIPRDVLTRSLSLSESLDKRGSYAALWAELEIIRNEYPALYHVAMSVAYQPLCEEPIEPVRRVVVALCELLACRIEGEIRVPAGVPIWSKDELEQRSREAKAALAYGHSDWARATRAERKRMILLLHGEGHSDGKIAARFGLSRGWVQRIRAGLVEALDESNGHEEAA